MNEQDMNVRVTALCTLVDYLFRCKAFDRCKCFPRVAVAEALATGDAGALQGGPGWREM